MQGWFTEDSTREILDACNNCHVSFYKGEVLHRWNQFASLQEALKFPNPDFNENMFPDWLQKITWWAQVLSLVLGLQF
jgi:hypothetical protein